MQTGLRGQQMATKNASTVSVMPIRENPDAAVLDLLRSLLNISGNIAPSEAL
jgi:hypothetical protein